MYAPPPASTFSSLSMSAPPSTTSPYGSHPPSKATSSTRISSTERLELTQLPHPVMAFGFGGKMALIFPAQSSNTQPFAPSHSAPFSSQSEPSSIRVVSLRSVLEGSRVVTALRTFPGPLHASSAKEAVNKFINERVVALQSDPAAPVGPRLDARRLLWELLKVSIKHYGNISRRQAASDESGDCLKAVEELLVPHDASFVGGAAVPDTMPTATAPAYDAQVLAQVQQHILAGNLREAWRVALEARLWTHALVLSRQVDEAAFQTTTAQLALTSFADGSPLRALYLLFANSPELFKAQPQDAAGRPGASTLLDRWQENLAMLLAARKGDSASPAIGRLGDVLWARFGCVEAAHFCYLLADHALQELDNPNSRVVLLGADHKLRRRLFVAADALQRSEILEYSRKLGNSQFSAACLQPYKLLYAAQLADFGLVDAAARYLQLLLPLTRGKGAQAFHPLFVYHLNAFADRMAHSASGVSASLSNTGSWKVLGSISSGLGSIMSRGLNVLIGSGAEEDEPAGATAASPFGAVSAPPASVASTTFMPEAQGKPTKPQGKPPQSRPPPPQAQPQPKAKDEKLSKPKPSAKAAAAGDDGGSAGGNNGRWGGWLSSLVKKPKNPVHLGKKLDLAAIAATAAEPPPPPPSDMQLGAPPMASTPPMTMSGPPAGMPAGPAGAWGAPPPGLSVGPAPAGVPAAGYGAAPAADAGASRFSRFGGGRAGQRRYLDTAQAEHGVSAVAALPTAPPNMSAFMPPPPPQQPAAAFAAFMPPPQDAQQEASSSSSFQLPDFLSAPTPLPIDSLTASTENVADGGSGGGNVSSWPDASAPAAGARSWIDDS